MSDLNIFLEQRRYFRFGMDQVAAGKTIYEILHGEVVLDDTDESEPVKFEDLQLEHSSAVLLGIAVAYEDVLRELPKRTVKKAKQAAFHTDDIGTDDE